MVFGFGFNKVRVLASAEKNVKQGRLQNAIADYERILKEDPKDLTVMNTVGDLYARVGNPAKATEYFRKVGDIYAREGFTVKAIAMYKKLTKQDASALDITMKLGELYTQQGLYNDARSQYLQVAEHNLRKGENQAAAKIFQKMLELDPENIQLQGRLAELYVKVGRNVEARDLYFRNAEAFRTRGSLDLADDALGQVLKLDSGFSQGIQLRAAVKVESGDPQAAVDLLEKLPDIDSRPDAMRTLLKGLLDTGKLADAEPVARKLLRIFNDASGIIGYGDVLMANGSHEQALQFYREHADRLLVTNMTRLMEALQQCIARVKTSSSSLEILMELFQRSGNNIYQVEVTELLAHAYVQEEKLSKACDLYKRLIELEPENAQHANNYRQIAARVGKGGGKNETPPAIQLDTEPKTFAVEEIQPGTPLVQNYAAEVAEAVEAAITDSELFDSYNLAPKAIPPLEAVLPMAPDDIRVNQRLASLYARCGRLKQSAERCRVLERVYREAGHIGDAAQFRELADCYCQKSGMAVEAAPVAVSRAPVAESDLVEPKPNPPLATKVLQPPVEMAAQVPAPSAERATEPVSAPEPAALSQPPVESESAHEFDLSDEWDQMLETSEPEVLPAKAPPEVAPATAQPIHDAATQTTEWDSFEVEQAHSGDDVEAELLEEANFYLAQSMWAEARVAIGRYETVLPGSPELARLKAELAAGARAGSSESEAAEPEIVTEQAAAVVAPATPPLPESAAVPLMAAAAAAPASNADGRSKDLLGAFVSDLEASLGDNFLLEKTPVEAVSAAPVVVPARIETPAPPVVMAAPAPAVLAPPVVPGPSAPDLIPARADTPPIEEEQAPNALSDIFAEFKESMEAGNETQEDPETHYNLGVAFKEMGLLDEAIGELQKVCQAMEHGHDFPQAMQAYTWLADCFLQQGVPEAAVRWYEKALKTRHIDAETTTALHYELACALEAAGNRQAALSHFMEVYGTNIDYRDVAERIKGLKS